VYWGANVGYSWGKSKYDATLTGVGTVSYSQNIDGAIGGVQTGYNYQFGAWVWGLETDIQASGEKGGSTLTGALPLTSVTTDDKLQWFGTTRGRLGVLATPNVLFYGTGGAAYGLVKNSATITVAGVSAVGTFSDLRAGWTAGGGWAPNSNISIWTSAGLSKHSAALEWGRSPRRLAAQPTTSCASV